MRASAPTTAPAEEPRSEQAPTQAPARAEPLSVADESQLLGRWIADPETASATRASLRESAEKALEAMQQAAGDAGPAVHGDVDQIVDGLARALAESQLEFSRDNLVVTRGGDRKLISYRIVGRGHDTLQLSTSVTVGTWQPDAVQVRFVGADKMELESSSGMAFSMLFRRVSART